MNAKELWEKWLKVSAYVFMTILCICAWIILFVVISYLGIFIYEVIA